MGKAADNERRKLFATFLNNLAVAAVITGAFVPFFALYQTGDIRVPVAETFEREGFWIGLSAVFVAFCTAFTLRMLASMIASRIED